MNAMDDTTLIAAREAALAAEVRDARREVAVLKAQIELLTNDVHFLRLALSRVGHRLATREAELSRLAAFAARAASHECSPFARLVLEHVASLALRDYRAAA